MNNIVKQTAKVPVDKSILKFIISVEYCKFQCRIAKQYLSLLGEQSEQHAYNITATKQPVTVHLDVKSINFQIFVSPFLASVQTLMEGYFKKNVRIVESNFLNSLTNSQKERIRRFRNTVYHYSSNYDDPEFNQLDQSTFELSFDIVEEFSRMVTEYMSNNDEIMNALNNQPGKTFNSVIDYSLADSAMLESMNLSSITIDKII